MPQTIKSALFAVNFHQTDDTGSSRVRFAAGQAYPLADDTDGELRRCIARGIATEVDVDAAPEAPEAAATAEPQEPTAPVAGDAEPVQSTAAAAPAAGRGKK